jgi:hypothetical protein
MELVVRKSGKEETYTSITITAKRNKKKAQNSVDLCEHTRYHCNQSVCVNISGITAISLSVWTNAVSLQSVGLCEQKQYHCNQSVCMNISRNIAIGRPVWTNTVLFQSARRCKQIQFIAIGRPVWINAVPSITISRSLGTNSVLWNPKATVRHVSSAEGCAAAGWGPEGEEMVRGTGSWLCRFEQPEAACTALSCPAACCQAAVRLSTLCRMHWQHANNYTNARRENKRTQCVNCVDLQLLHCFVKYALKYSTRTRRDLNWMEHTVTCLYS